MLSRMDCTAGSVLSVRFLNAASAGAGRTRMAAGGWRMLMGVREGALGPGPERLQAHAALLAVLG